jgi:hypothetical protein
VQEEAPQTDYTPTATIKDLMDSIVDPSADVVWNAVMTSVDASGTEDKFPRTDEEWADVRRGAIRLVESSNLLLVPGRHVAGPGEKSVPPRRRIGTAGDGSADKQGPGGLERMVEGAS